MEHRWNLKILCAGRSRPALIMAALPMGPKRYLPPLALTDTGPLWSHVQNHPILP